MAETAERWMKAAGLWRGTNSLTLHPWARISVSILLISCVAQTVTLLTSFGDSQRLIDCFSIVSFCLMGVVKFTSMIAHVGRWKTLITLAQSSERQQIKLERCASESNVEYDTDEDCDEADECRYSEKIAGISFGLPLMYWSTGVIFIIAPFVEYAYLYSNNRHSGSLHILPVWAPFDDYVFANILTIILEAISAIYCVSVHVAFDVTSISFMILIGGRFGILRRGMECIGGAGLFLLKLDRRDRRAHYLIIKCHKHHLILIEMNRILGSLMKPSMEIYINFVTLTLCATAVQLTNPISTVQQLKLIAYICASVTQLFFFCTFGDAVLNESNIGAGAGALGAAWWCLGRRARSELRILALATARPLRLRAGWFHILNRPTFLSVLQTAYSFYAVLSKKQ